MIRIMTASQRPAVALLRIDARAVDDPCQRKKPIHANVFHNDNLSFLFGESCSAASRSSTWTELCDEFMDSPYVGCCMTSGSADGALLSS